MLQDRRLSRSLPAGATACLLWVVIGCNARSTPAPIPLVQDTSTADVDAQEPDSDAVGEAGDTALDATDATTPTQNPLCAADLPIPGAPCTTKGEIRCSNVGATVDGAIGCFRPNYAECQESAGGNLAWTLGACQQQLAQTEAPFCQKVATCMIWGQVHRCQPAVLFASVNIAKLGGVPMSHSQHLACPNEIGQVKCEVDHIDTCTRFADLPPDVAAEVKAQYHPECGHFLDLGYYWFPVQACPNLAISCECKKPKPPNDCAVPTVYQTQCFLDPATNQPACQKTCHDVGAYGY